MDEFVFPGIFGTVLHVIGIPFMVHSHTVNNWSQYFSSMQIIPMVQPKLSFQRVVFLVFSGFLKIYSHDYGYCLRETWFCVITSMRDFTEIKKQVDLDHHVPPYLTLTYRSLPSISGMS